MQFNFQDIINALNAQLPQSDNFAFQMARNGRVPGDYVLNAILPNENRTNYHVDGGTLTVTPTMIGQVPMDTPYPPFGAMSASQFLENTTKLGGSMFFPEKHLRDILQYEDSLISLGVRDGMSVGQIMGDLTLDDNGRGNAATVYGRRINALLDLAGMIRQSHWDRLEWMKGQVLFTGSLNWNFNGIPLAVDYDIPTANKPAQRTGNDGYGGSTSKFWDDIRWLHTKLTNFTVIMNERTWLTIINNPANNIRVTVNEGQTREIIYWDSSAVNQAPDARDRVRIVIYNKSGSILKKQGDQGVLEAVQFVPDGKIAVIGEVQSGEIELLQGATADPNNRFRLGYTHIAPTVEGGNRPGIWAQIYTPEQMPMQVIARTAANVLPVILNPKRLVILDTEIP